MHPDLDQIITNARSSLLAERNPQGHWTGELSSSALSTATAIVALHCVDPAKHADLIRGGAKWLIDTQNEDGGWGDTTISLSNISTTILAWSALSLVSPENRNEIERSQGWIQQNVGGTEPALLVKKVTERYGRDRTFAVPILMTCAICGRLGEDKRAWSRVLALPFELAALPREWFAALRFPVVSYALPALIAIGYARFFNAPPLPPLSNIRAKVWPKASELLTRIQPESGGFLEAAPLTSFVTMALAVSGQRDHSVVIKGSQFLVESVLEDGSWPIDTNLATWTTTLATKALTIRGEDPDFSEDARSSILKWLLDQQYKEVHPYTGAAPGGWAWTDLTGGVPDADDTPGALLALRALNGNPGEELTDAATQAVAWLLDLQNRDGGMPTFCRGWGTQPFDRSSPDLTAHTLRAWNAWKEDVDSRVRANLDRGADRALMFLRREQARDGSWTPLWFGNERAKEETNKTYGTAMVLLALREIEDWQPVSKNMGGSAMTWLLSNQNEDGGWGGELGCPSSIEETALALDAIAAGLPRDISSDRVVAKAIEFLKGATKGGTEFSPSPIGFYFAKLWYFERLYPKIWTVSALERVKRNQPKPS
tara:strand:+ start:4036 stop:5832 length:1797 start_codon:yes stop_codon:yes gene_type:complete